MNQPIRQPLKSKALVRSQQGSSLSLGERVGARAKASSTWLLTISVLGLLSFFSTAVQAQEPTGLQMALAMEQLVVDAIAKAEKSVVAIARIPRDSKAGGDSREPTDPEFIPDVFGSGVVIDRRGYILTNAHVLGFDPKRKDQYRYYVWHEHRPFSATVVERPDEATVTAVSGFRDLAVLKITPPSDLTAITFGDTSKLRKGNIVIALGNPYATGRDGEASASWGIVSNLSRKAPRPLTAQQGEETLADWGNLIQCDARLNIGSSGGALLNLRGEMIGLTTSLAALYGYEKSGGFAIPMDANAQAAIKKLKMGREAEVGFLGLSPATMPLEEIREGNFGIKVASVVDGAPASKAGLQIGDIITHIGDQPIYNKSTFMRDIATHQPDSTVRLKITRNSFGRIRPTIFDVSVTLAKKYIETKRPSYARQPPPSWRGLSVDYATALPLEVYQNRLDLIDRQGCVTLPNVEVDSLAWKAGARPWMFVSHVNQQRVSKPSEFRRIVQAATGEVELTMTTGDKFQVADKTAE